MPLRNGDVASSSAVILPGQKTLDHTKALEILSTDFPSGDGLDAKTLLDSRINGGLTYNDFLVLPGYIGIVRSPGLNDGTVLMLYRLRCFTGSSGYTSN